MDIANESLVRIEQLVNADFTVASASVDKTLKHNTTHHGVGTPRQELYDTMYHFSKHNEALATRLKTLVEIYGQVLTEQKLDTLTNDNESLLKHAIVERCNQVIAVHRGSVAAIFKDRDEQLPIATVEAGITDASNIAAAAMERLFKTRRDDIEATRVLKEQKKAQLAVRSQFMANPSHINPDSLSQFNVAPATAPEGGTVDIQTPRLDSIVTVVDGRLAIASQEAKTRLQDKRSSVAGQSAYDSEYLASLCLDALNYRAKMFIPTYQQALKQFGLTSLSEAEMHRIRAHASTWLDTISLQHDDDEHMFFTGRTRQPVPRSSQQGVEATRKATMGELEVFLRHYRRSGPLGVIISAFTSSRGSRARGRTKAMQGSLPPDKKFEPDVQRLPVVTADKEPHWYKRTVLGALLVAGLGMASWSWQERVKQRYEARGKIANSVLPVLQRLSNAVFPYGEWSPNQLPNPDSVRFALRGIDSAYVASRAALAAQFSADVVMMFDSLSKMSPTIRKQAVSLAADKRLDFADRVLEVELLDDRMKAFVASCVAAGEQANRIQEKLIDESNR